MTPREIDVLVAEKVLGWTRKTFQLTFNSSRGKQYADELPYTTSFSAEGITDGARVHIFNHTDQPYNLKDMPNYSTDMGAAWEIVEKLNMIDFRLEKEDYGWVCEFYTKDSKGGYGAADKPALAICRAVLGERGSI